ncbi:hypothetical protein ID866_4037 [Astraeus odoratus]|nr:hypothetical protein ID866_4037 [Astraeus odoratus]
MSSTSQAAAHALVESVVIKILHAHNFARTSSQALSVLSNLLTRYLVLVASACGQYGDLAGRSQLSVCDILACLDELGSNMDELSEYCSTEGIELSRYTVSSAKRLDDLAEFRSTSIHLHTSEHSEDIRVRRSETPEEFEYGLRFLPPLPDASRPRSVSPPPVPEPVKFERPPSPLPQHIASATTADYATQVPYSDSVLASAPPWHLPNPHPPSASSKPQAARFPTPSAQQALLSAYHHILTHPVTQIPPANPAKHKVAMALLGQIQNNPRWDAPSTLYGNIVPCNARVTTISPSYPIPISTLEDIRAGKEVDEKKSMLPPAPARPVFSSDKPVFLTSQQASRLPELARQVLPGAVLARTTRLTHPPVLQRGPQKLIYGPGINAPWNSSSTGGTGQTSKANDEAVANGREAPSFTLPDAQMFATWDYEVKHYQDPLTVRRGRIIGVPHPQKRS